jgi:hypothetical protein
MSEQDEPKYPLHFYQAKLKEAEAALAAERERREGETKTLADEYVEILGKWRGSLRGALYPFWPNNPGVGDDEIIDAVRRAVIKLKALEQRAAGLEQAIEAAQAVYSSASVKQATHGWGELMRQLTALQQPEEAQTPTHLNADGVDSVTKMNQRVGIMEIADYNRLVESNSIAEYGRLKAEAERDHFYEQRNRYKAALERIADHCKPGHPDWAQDHYGIAAIARAALDPAAGERP